MSEYYPHLEKYLRHNHFAKDTFPYPEIYDAIVTFVAERMAKYIREFLKNRKANSGWDDDLDILLSSLIAFPVVADQVDLSEANPAAYIRGELKLNLEEIVKAYKSDLKNVRPKSRIQTSSTTAYPHIAEILGEKYYTQLNSSLKEPVVAALATAIGQVFESELEAKYDSPQDRYRAIDGILRSILFYAVASDQLDTGASSIKMDIDHIVDHINGKNARDVTRLRSNGRRDYLLDLYDAYKEDVA